MRILVVHPGPPLSQHDVWRGWEKALRQLGHRVVSFRTDQFLLQFCQWPPTPETVEAAQQEMLKAVRLVKPDFTFFVGSFFLNAELLEHCQVPVVIRHTESPYEDKRQIELAPCAVLNLVNDSLNLADYERGLYVPASYDPGVHYPGDGLKDIDFTFIGSALPSRVEFFTSMDLDGIDACIDGGGWSHNGVANEDAAGLYRRTKVGINFYRREGETDQGWSMGPRELELAACGTFFLRDPRGEGDEILDMLPAFSDAGEASEELRWWLGHDGPRKERALQAMDAIKDRTFYNEAVKMMTALEDSL